MSGSAAAPYFTEASDGSGQGPFTKAEIACQISDGVLKESDLIFNQDTGQWIPASEISRAICHDQAKATAKTDWFFFKVIAAVVLILICVRWVVVSSERQRVQPLHDQLTRIFATVDTGVTAEEFRSLVTEANVIARQIYPAHKPDTFDSGPSFSDRHDFYALHTLNQANRVWQQDIGYAFARNDARKLILQAKNQFNESSRD
jgi:hypothetical protein